MPITSPAMQMKDSQALSGWISSKASLKDVESTARYGLVDNERFTENAVRAFRLLWAWSATRLHGDAGRRQHRFRERCGQAALDRRFERARAWIKKLA